ncbi:hypothetical protein RND71_017450 [Anisodus tanguticus]|uniref:C3H1-type domain-containing protein n=1 Tax=Anisodus tanguticus TaxID=243964 RepID=A0AAE1S3J0_9SOLA|nr:hypothetical protein RND71_017450 [Anisodus tanguticus]
MSLENKRSNVPSILGPQPACLQFKRWGSCAYGDKCRYVHITGPTYGPSMNIGVGKTEPCRFFTSVRGCPYGNECQYLHERNRNVESGKGEYRESSAIRIATSGNEWRSKTTNSGTPPEPKRSVDFRTKFLKTRICTKWKKNGSCSYGSTCQFAHGQGGLFLVLVLESSSSAGISALAKNVASDRIGFIAPSKCRLSFKCTNMRKNSQVYADWPPYL